MQLVCFVIYTYGLGVGVAEDRRLPFQECGCASKGWKKFDIPSLCYVSSNSALESNLHSELNSMFIRHHVCLGDFL